MGIVADLNNPVLTIPTQVPIERTIKSESGQFQIFQAAGHLLGGGGRQHPSMTTTAPRRMQSVARNFIASSASAWLSISKETEAFFDQYFM